MRRQEKECTNQAIIDEFLAASQIMQLALNTPDSAPYIVPVNFLYDGESLYFHGAQEGRKIELLRRNPAVGFVVCEMLGIVEGATPCSTGTRFKSIIGTARAEFLENEDKQGILNLLLAKFTNYQPVEFAPEIISKIAVIKLNITEISFKVDAR